MKKIEEVEKRTFLLPGEIILGETVFYKHDFDVVYADPPWMQGQLGKYGAINHYRLMSTKQIKEMPVAELCKKDVVLFLWSTNGVMKHAIEVMEAWGFKYRTYFVWCKNGLGLGQPLRNSTEICLVGIKGHMQHAFNGQMNWGFLPKQNHSHKPEEMYAIIERLYPGSSYLELFARNRPSNKDWYIWGDQAEGGGDIVIPGYPVPLYSDRVKFVFPEPRPDLPADELEKLGMVHYSNTSSSKDNPDYDSYKGKHEKEEA